MTPEARKDALDRLNLALIGLNQIEQDSSLVGRIRIRAAEIKKHLRLVDSAIRGDQNNHLGAVSDAPKEQTTK